MTVTYGGGPMCGCTSCIERDVTSNQASFPPGYDLYWEELGYLEVDQSHWYRHDMIAAASGR